jgi:hypothetical protein
VEKGGKEYEAVNALMLFMQYAAPFIIESEHDLSIWFNAAFFKL